jgi:hypothetical protein
MPTEKEIIILIRIKEIYTGILENRLSIIIIESISINRASIPLVIIIPSRMIIASWFNRNIIRNKRVIISDSGYTNKSICLIWLDYFIKHNNCRPNAE